MGTEGYFRRSGDDLARFREKQCAGSGRSRRRAVDASLFLTGTWSIVWASRPVMFLKSLPPCLLGEYFQAVPSAEVAADLPCGAWSFFTEDTPSPSVPELFWNRYLEFTDNRSLQYASCRVHKPLVNDHVNGLLLCHCKSCQFHHVPRNPFHGTPKGVNKQLATTNGGVCW